MNAAEQTARIKILNAMGLGPLWLSRYASEEVTPVVATLRWRMFLLRLFCLTVVSPML
jgi:hypothetical protein